MKKLPLPLVLLVLCACGIARAQGSGAAAHPPGTVVIDPAQSQDWMTSINSGWLVHEGDNPAYAQTAFNDSAWQSVNLEDLGPAKPGSRWYRLHVKLPADHPQLALLIEGGEGTYAIYANGVPVPGPQISSSLSVREPTERAIPLNVSGPDLEIALRIHIPPSYDPTWRAARFMTASLGTPTAIDLSRRALESTRMYRIFPVLAVNLLLMLAGIGAFVLYRSQPSHSEYMWLGLYLILTGLSALLWGSMIGGFLPLSANLLAADPLVYAFTIAQIEFTFSFGGQRVGRAWRVYEALLLAPVTLALLTWLGHMSSAVYFMIEALIVIPAAVLLPVLLLFWYRRGNREAGWLILPSLLPSALVTLNGIGLVSDLLGWSHLDILSSPIPIGVVQLMPNDVGSLLFLLAVAFIMFFRFTRVSRDQARAAAELDAAREIQQRLVPASLPAVPGYHLEAAYLPAQEVGGDFYQVLPLPDGSALIVVGDVSGKGLKAAMTGALAIGGLRTLAAEDLGPAALLARLNRLICDSQDGGFITCLCARVNPEGIVTVANAGHLSPYRRGEEVAVESDLPLGIAAPVEYQETQFHLEPGDTLTLLSDGVVEAKDVAGQLYGFERTRIISIQSAQSIAAAAQAFGQEDDITVLTVARV